MQGNTVIAMAIISSLGRGQAKWSDGLEHSYIFEILINKMTQLELPLPEITVEDFSRAWTRFGLVAVAKGWDGAKQLAVLLRGKFLDYYLDLGDNDKATLQALKAALKKRRLALTETH